MKKPIFFCFLLLTAHLIGKQSQIQDEVDYLLYRIDNPPTNYCPDNGVGFAFFISPLYWRSAEEGLEYAIVGPFSTAPFNNNSIGAETHEPDFGWDWGVRVGLNYNLPIDSWDLYSDWTHFRTTASDHVFVSGNPDPSIVANTNSAGQYVSPFWVAKLFDNPGFHNDGKAKWEMRLDMIDLLMGRQYMVSESFFLKPFIGLRNGWIYQKYNVSFFEYGFPTIPDELNRITKVRMRNNYWGIGAKLGMNSDWVLGEGFSIFGNLALSILDGFFKLTYKLDDVTLNQQAYTTLIFPPNIEATVIELPQKGTYSNKNHIHRNVAIAELSLGLKWEKQLMDDRACLSLWGGFEQNIFFEQNQFMNHQYDFSLITIILGGMNSSSGGPNYFTDRGHLTTSGFTGGADLSF